MLTQARRLYDIATRQQIYVEGVKAKQAQQFNKYLIELRKEFSDIFATLQYKTLDGLTKLELNRFLVKLRNSQTRIYNNYTTLIVAQLEDFMHVNLQVSRRIWATSHLELDSDEKQIILSDSEAKFYIEQQSKQNNFIPLFGLAAVTTNSSRLWGNVWNMPIPANGLMPAKFIGGFGISAMAGVENVIRKGWSNRENASDVLNELVGGETNQLTKTQVQSAAMTATMVQHVSAITSAAVASALFGAYVWYSIIDNGTTPICQSRNLKRYRYGEGPLPPAHIKCRSHTAPSVGSDDAPAETFYAFMSNQPEAFQNDTMGDADAESLRAGKTKSANFRYVPEQLTIDEYNSKTRSILNR